MPKIIMGIQLKDRLKDSVKFQGLISEYGCIIQTRLGLHEAQNVCSAKGLILLEFTDGSDEEVSKFEKELKEIENIEVQKMVFSV